MKINLLEAITVIPRCLGSIAFLFLITKIMGKKQVSQFSLFDYVIGISIGNFTAEMTLNREVQYINGMMAILTFGILSYVISKLINKSINIRKFIIGTPTILIDKGKIIEKNLKKVNIDVNDLLEDARISGYFDISEIEFAIMEANGSISFLVKSEFKNPTISDLKLKNNRTSLSANLIVNGEYMEDAIKHSNITKKELIQEIKKMNLNTPDSILLCTLTNSNLKFYFKDEKEKNQSLLE
ncbi:MAG: DUF421 domain-containing protein [Bacilli bacterium]|nr:DUF421 domain-containing protein [Bacilli bacterium]